MTGGLVSSLEKIEETSQQMSGNAYVLNDLHHRRSSELVDSIMDEAKFHTTKTYLKRHVKLTTRSGLGIDLANGTIKVKFIKVIRETTKRYRKEQRKSKNTV